MDGSTEKSRSGIAAGILNATQQTGSVLGVALFGSLVGGDNAFMTDAHASSLFLFRFRLRSLRVGEVVSGAKLVRSAAKRRAGLGDLISPPRRPLSRMV
jgi:hypothetical protein